MNPSFIPFAVLFTGSASSFAYFRRQRNQALGTSQFQRTTWPPQAMRAGRNMNLATIFGLASFVVLYLLSLN